MTRNFSGKIFDRHVGPEPNLQRIASGLTALAANVHAPPRAVGVNVEADWRVSIQRQKIFCDAFSSSLVPIDIEKMLKIFFTTRIRRSMYPDFLQPYNASNRRDAMNQDVELCNVFVWPDIPKLTEAAAEKAGLGKVTNRSEMDVVLQKIFPADAFYDSSDDPRRPLSLIQQEFLGDFLRPLTADYHPGWSGFWDEFKPFAGISPDCWLSAFGLRLATPSRARLCLVFRYKIEDINGPVFMPTFLDADCNSEHFPSPGPPCTWRIGSDVPKGGHPMSLRAETDRDLMLQEFIHQDFTRRTSMIVFWGWSNPTVSPRGLEQARMLHYDRLNKHYSGVPLWLREPI